MKAYLDNNVVCSISKDDHKSESTAVTQLLKARKSGKLEVVTSEITLEEIKKCPEKYRPPLERIFLLLEEVPIVRWDELIRVSSCGDKLTWINVPMIFNDPLYDSFLSLGLESMDVRHLFVATKKGCEVFLTCDDKPPTSILARAAAIVKLCGMRVQRPSEFIASQGW